MSAELTIATTILNSAKEKMATKGSAKVYGLPASMNCCGPIMLAFESGAGGMELCNIMEGAHKTPEYAQVNAYQLIPGLKDGDVCIGESCAILRYLGLTYMPSAYPLDQPALCARIDFAMDAFSNVYKFHRETVYVTFGYSGPPADQKKAVADYLAQCDKWLGTFVGDGPFVGGSGSPTIADYKAVPFFFAAMQPACQKTIGLAMPPKVTAYVDAFCAAVKSSGFMSSAGGYSLKEYAATKM